MKLLADRADLVFHVHPAGGAINGGKQVAALVMVRPLEAGTSRQCAQSLLKLFTSALAPSFFG